MEKYLSVRLLFTLALASGRETRDIAALLNPHHAYLTALLRFKCRNPDLAEDLLQETYLAFLSSGGAEKVFSSPEKLRNYLITIALNKFRDWLRRSRRVAGQTRTFRTREELDQTLDSLEAGLPDPGEALADGDEKRRLAACVALVMEGLPERQREVLLLKFRQDLDNNSLARTLGLDIKALESLVHRAKVRFRKDFLKAARDFSLDRDPGPAAPEFSGTPKDFLRADVHNPREVP